MTLHMNDITIIHSTGNRKPVFCISDLKRFNSATEAAKYYGVSLAAISWVITGRAKTCKSKRFCAVSDMPYHAEEIEEVARTLYGKATKYDAIVAEHERIKAEQERKARMAKELEELKAQRTEFLHETKRKLTETDEAIKALEEALNA